MTCGVFNPAAFLRCVSCGATAPCGPRWWGCEACGTEQPLVVDYLDGTGAGPDGDPLPARVQALSRARLPIDPDRVLALGHGRTPLIPGGQLGPATWLKVEGSNPTGSHKDRFHAVAGAIARDLDYGALITSSTGNHGAAAAASAAATGLSALVFLHPRSPAALRDQLHAYGAVIADQRIGTKRLLRELVKAGWYPSTGADPGLSGVANPYGLEGYKAIAHELVSELGEAPDAVLVPAASGDTAYGVWRGFRELHEGLGITMPRILACQPAGAAPLLATVEDGGRRPVELAATDTFALSTADRRSGWHTSLALALDGAVIAVPDMATAEALSTLGQRGTFVEPASAVAVAGLAVARSAGLLDREATTVIVLTSSGTNWVEHTREVLGTPTVAADARALFAALATRNLALPLECSP